MEYRGINYYYKEWTTWNGKQASAYYCDDENLLRDLQLKSFGESTKEEMHSRIDYIINNYDKEIEKQVLSHKAALEFYNLKQI